MLCVRKGKRKIPDGALRLVVLTPAHDGGTRVLVLVFVGPLPDVADQIHHAERTGAFRMRVHRIGTATIGGHRADVLSFPEEMRLAFDQRTGQLLEQIDLLPHRTRGYPDVAGGSVVLAIAFSTAVAPTIDTPIHVRGVTPVDGPRP